MKNNIFFKATCIIKFDEDGAITTNLKFNDGPEKHNVCKVCIPGYNEPEIILNYFVKFGPSLWEPYNPWICDLLECLSEMIAAKNEYQAHMCELAENNLNYHDIIDEDELPF